MRLIVAIDWTYIANRDFRISYCKAKNIHLLPSIDKPLKTLQIVVFIIFIDA